MTAEATWREAPLPAVIVPAAIGAARAAELRARFDGGYRRFALVDRGSYDVREAPDVPELEILRGIGCAITGRDLALASARVLRFVPGDYLLVRSDRVHEDRPVELVLDLSAAAFPDAEVHWRHRGQVYFTMPSVPGSLAIVERGPTVLANHTYLTKRATGEVVRLCALLREDAHESARYSARR